MKPSNNLDSRFIMTFLTILEDTEILCSLKLILEGKTGKEIPKSSCKGLFFNKVAGHQACNFTKKRFQHRYDLVDIRKFIRRTILKNISKRGHCWKVFWENSFHIRSELCKRICWLDDLMCKRLLKLVKTEWKCFL